MKNKYTTNKNSWGTTLYSQHNHHYHSPSPSETDKCKAELVTVFTNANKLHDNDYIVGNCVYPYEWSYLQNYGACKRDAHSCGPGTFDTGKGKFKNMDGVTYDKKDGICNSPIMWYDDIYGKGSASSHWRLGDINSIKCNPHKLAPSPTTK